MGKARGADHLAQLIRILPADLLPRGQEPMAPQERQAVLVALGVSFREQLAPLVKQIQHGIQSLGKKILEGLEPLLLCPLPRLGLHQEKRSLRCHLRHAHRGAQGAGLKGFPFHDLREDSCSWLTMRRVPMRAVQRLAGHTNLRMTKRCSHLAEKVLVEAVPERHDARAGLWPTA